MLGCGCNISKEQPDTSYISNWISFPKYAKLKSFHWDSSCGTECAV